MRARHVPPSTSAADITTRAQRAPAPLAAGQQTVDEQAQRVLELGAGARLGQLEGLLETLGRAARDERRVAPAGEVVGQRARAARSGRPARRAAAPRAPPACGSRGARAAPGSARRRLARAQQGDRQRRQVGAPARSGRSGAISARRARARPAAARAAKREGATPRRTGRPQRAAHGGQHALEPAVQLAQAARVEPRLARPARTPPRAPMPSSARQHAVPRVRHPRGIGRHQPQGGTARERLPQPQPRADAARLGGGRGLADALLAPRLGGERDRPRGQPGTAAGGDGELEARNQDADDHRTHVRISRARKGKASAPAWRVAPVGGDVRAVLDTRSLPLRGPIRSDPGRLRAALVHMDAYEVQRPCIRGT